MIPKTIHYCWFGHNPKPELAQKCFASWQKYCPDYEIIEWNEDNYDIQSAPLFVRQAYEAKKWAFVTDYVRLKVVYEHGGIYLDTDVEVIKPLDDLLHYNAFFGIQYDDFVNTGLGFGALAGNIVLRKMMKSYESTSFLKVDGSFDTTTCLERDRSVFINLGLNECDDIQVLHGNIAVFPVEYMAPKNYMTGETSISEKTHTIHHFAESWMTEKQKKEMEEVKRSLYHPTLKERFKRWAVRTFKKNKN